MWICNTLLQRGNKWKQQCTIKRWTKAFCQWKATLNIARKKETTNQRVCLAGVKVPL